MENETRPTHEVTDLVYHEDEPNFIAIQGTLPECEKFLAEQKDFLYQIRLIIKH